MHNDPTTLDRAYAEAVCKIGCGYQTCRYLVMRTGLSCEKHTHLGRVLDMRVKLGEQIASGDNCAGKIPRHYYGEL